MAFSEKSCSLSLKLLKQNFATVVPALGENPSHTHMQSNDITFVFQECPAIVATSLVL